jgi:hypothetical protein
MAKKTRIMVQFGPTVMAWIDAQPKSRSRVLEDLVLTRMQGEAPKANIRLREFAARVNGEG